MLPPESSLRGRKRKELDPDPLVLFRIVSPRTQVRFRSPVGYRLGTWQVRVASTWSLRRSCPAISGSEGNAGTRGRRRRQEQQPGRAKLALGRKLTVNTDGGSALRPSISTSGLTRQLPFVFYLNGVKGQSGVGSVGADGCPQGSVVDGGPGNARFCGTVVDLADHVLVGAEPEQRPPRRQADPEALNAPR